MSFYREFEKGILRENPVLVIALGMCPTLAVTTAAVNGLGMGAAFTFVLVGSNVIISFIRKWVPSRIRIPVYIVIIATFVTIVKLVMAAYTPALSATLGIFVPLIVVNCIVLGRAEAFASKATVSDALADGLGMGVGFTLVLLIIGSIREILGQGTIFGVPIMGSSYNPALSMILPTGGFLTLGSLLALIQHLKRERK